VAVLFRSSTLPSAPSVVLIHLTLPPLKWLQPLPVGVGLRTLLSLLPYFFAVPSGPVAFFSFRPWGDVLSCQLDFPLSSLRTPLPSVAASGAALLRLASRLRQV
jgi:hypothetical protein